MPGSRKGWRDTAIRSGPRFQHRGGDHWIQVSERKIVGGGSVAVYTDITELTKREESLRQAKEQATSPAAPRPISSPT